MPLASSSSIAFGVERCRDQADQDRRIWEFYGNTRCLDLAPLRCKKAVKSPEPWVFSTARSGEVDDLVPGLLTQSKRRRVLSLFPPPRMASPGDLWAGIDAFIREHDVKAFSVEAAGLDSPEIAELRGETRRGTYAGLWIDLTTEPLPLPKNHRRNVQRALKQGATLRETAELDDARRHIALCTASLERLEGRGERVQGVTTLETVETVLRSGLGRLYQAWIGEQLLSSDLVITVERAAYYASGGTAPEGRKAGTAHVLMDHLIRALREEGFRSLNMGYPNGPGLTRFKAGFGAQPYAVERVEVERSPFLERVVRGVVRAARR